MAKQTLMWTALPNGLDANGNLRLSALLSPRLEPNGNSTVAGFPDFVDWPLTLSSARFAVRCGAATVELTLADIDPVLDAPDSATWKALIPETTFVRGHKFKDLSSASVLSYDVSEADGLLRNLYVSLARKASDDLPKLTEITQEAPWADVVGAVSLVDRLMAESRIPGGNGRARVPSPAPLFERYVQDGMKLGNPTAELLARAQLFHTPGSTPEVQDYSNSATMAADDPRRDAAWRTHRAIRLPDPGEFEKLIDFHQIIAAMNQYPRLLRRLGIVLDFVIPRGRLPLSPAAQTLTVECKLDGPETATRAFVRPRTMAIITDRSFIAAPRPNFNPGEYRIRRGLLLINPDFFTLVQNDVDAGVLKLMNFSRTLRLLIQGGDTALDPVTRYERNAGAPALRTAGLMLAQRRRGPGLKAALDTAKAQEMALQSALASNHPELAPALFAEDLVRGWRIDIWDGKVGRWYSLCERTARYDIGAGAVTLDDPSEGLVRLAATQSSDPASNQNLIWLHEALVSWTGWSLVARRPGQVVDKNDAPSGADAVVPPGIHLATQFRAKAGSLPRLRYGRPYWIRARAVDLAANSLSPSPDDIADEQPKDHATVFRRFEPVQPPALALVRNPDASIEKPLEGESMDRIAIRSFNATPPDNLIPTTAEAHRRAVPDRGDVRTAELHGMLDSGAGGTVNSAQSMFDLLATKDHNLAEELLKTPGPLAESEPVDTRYAVLESGATEIPYLPDPLCTEIAARLFNHPNFPSTNIITIPVYGPDDRWPYARPFTIRVVESPGGLPAFDPETRVLTVPLPKAVRATLRLSSKLEAGALDLMGVWNWMPDADRTAKLTAAARDGQHWMLTPWRDVELVHATQKPLIAPEMKVSLHRRWKSTNVVPDFAATCSLKSTARVDLQAEWNEPGPDVESDAVAANVSRADHAFSVKITDPTTYNMAGGKSAPEHSIEGPDLIRVSERTVAKLHEFGDTRYRRIEYWLEATTRFREFMPPSILTAGDPPAETDENIKVTGPRVVSWIPSSAPPPAPEVLSVVPTFGWTRTQSATAGTLTRWRHGGGLRVYLNRGWNRSGYGEMLAVVLPRAAFAGDPNDAPASRPYKRFVTQWGNDPAWKSSFVSGPSPAASAFPLARVTPDASGKWLPPFAPPAEADQAPGPFRTTDLTHPALGSPNLTDVEAFVDIAPHDVFWDAERQLWYCDIEVNFGASYFPFIRFALARYQPTSINGAHLSEIVLADFAQLTPDRWLTVTPAAANPRKRRVNVYGFQPERSSGGTEVSTVAQSTVVEVWVEKLDPRLGEDFGWRREPAAKVTPGPEPPPPTPGRGPGSVLLPGLRPIPGVSVGASDVRIGVSDARQLVRERVINPVLIWPQMWEGGVELPASASPQDRWRLVVAEYEEYIVDDANPYDGRNEKKDRRLVFVEHVELS